MTLPCIPPPPPQCLLQDLVHLPVVTNSLLFSNYSGECYVQTVHCCSFIFKFLFWLLHLYFPLTHHLNLICRVSSYETLRFLVHVFFSVVLGNLSKFILFREVIWLSGCNFTPNVVILSFFFLLSSFKKE